MSNCSAWVNDTEQETESRRNHAYPIQTNPHGLDVRGGIFDLDGTLLDSMFMWENLGTAYLQSRGITPTEDRSKMHLAQTAVYYKEKYGITDSPEQIRRDMDRIMEHFYFEEAELKPGVREMLISMKEHGIALCLATATEWRLVGPALERTGLIPYFSDFFTCKEIGHEKDRPDIYEAALASLGTKKKETMVFEDALYAVKTAKKAGFLVAGIRDLSSQRHWSEIDSLVDYAIQDWETFSVDHLLGIHTSNAIPSLHTQHLQSI
jgi:HAD superfamily hydrolase (TIGR01509 family)